MPVTSLRPDALVSHWCSMLKIRCPGTGSCHRRVLTLSPRPPAFPHEPPARLDDVFLLGHRGPLQLGVVRNRARPCRPAAPPARPENQRLRSPRWWPRSRRRNPAKRLASCTTTARPVLHTDATMVSGVQRTQAAQVDDFHVDASSASVSAAARLRSTMTDVAMTVTSRAFPPHRGLADGHRVVLRGHRALSCGTTACARRTPPGCRRG